MRSTFALALLCGITLAENAYEKSTEPFYFQNDRWWTGPTLTTSGGAKLAAGGVLAWQVEGEGENATFVSFEQ